MPQNRRNSISYNDGIAILVVAVISAIAAVLSDASPTGSTVLDIILVGALAAFVTWLGASAAWWALMAGAGIALVGSLPGPFVWIILATIAFTGSAWIGWDRANQPIVRAVIAAGVVQVSLRLEWNEFFLLSAIIAAIAPASAQAIAWWSPKRSVRLQWMPSPSRISAALMPSQVEAILMRIRSRFVPAFS